VAALAQLLLGMIRTRADLHRWGAANAHGRQMHEAVDLLRWAAAHDADGLLPVVEKAIAAAAGHSMSHHGDGPRWPTRRRVPAG
jgi:hypothetical protein